MKELQNQLLAGIKLNVAEYGFRFTSADRAFRKDAAGMRFSFHLAFIRHPTDFDVTVDLAVRYDQVEELVGSLTPLHPLFNGRKPFTWTIGVEVGNLTQGSQLRWSIFDETDVKTAIAGITATFHKVALPYFEMYRTPESAYSMLQRDDKVANLNSALRVKRWIRVAALAFLLEPEQMDFWLSRAAETLNAAQDVHLDQFEQFASALVARRNN